MIIATAASAKVCGISLALQTFQLADSNFKRKQVLMLWLVSIFTAQLFSLIHICFAFDAIRNGVSLFRLYPTIFEVCALLRPFPLQLGIIFIFCFFIYFFFLFIFFFFFFFFYLFLFLFFFRLPTRSLIYLKHFCVLFAFCKMFVYRIV